MGLFYVHAMCVSCMVVCANMRSRGQKNLHYWGHILISCNSEMKLIFSMHAPIGLGDRYVVPAAALVTPGNNDCVGTRSSSVDIISPSFFFPPYSRVDRWSLTSRLLFLTDFSFVFWDFLVVCTVPSQPPLPRNICIGFLPKKMWIQNPKCICFH